eukprot:g6317.t1
MANSFLFRIVNEESTCPVLEKFELDSLLALFDTVFKSSHDEIFAALTKSRTSTYNFENAFVAMLLAQDRKTILSASIAVKRNCTISGNTHTVVELLWQVTAQSHRGIGLGSKLFDEFYNHTKKQGAAAILVPSTNKALTFWLTRREKPIATTVLRSSEQHCLRRGGVKQENSRGKCHSLSPQNRGSDTSQGKEILSSIEREECDKMKAMRRQRVWSLGRLFRQRNRKKNEDRETALESLFVVVDAPPGPLRDFYTDRVYRNRRGRITKSSPPFCGSPYRYDTTTSNHVWFPLSKGLKRRLTKFHFREKQKKNKNNEPSSPHWGNCWGKCQSAVITHKRTARFYSEDVLVPDIATSLPDDDDDMKKTSSCHSSLSLSIFKIVTAKKFATRLKKILRKKVRLRIALLREDRKMRERARRSRQR